MPKTKVQDRGGREVHQGGPPEACEWQCMTCAGLLRDRSDVRAHWAAHNVGHSVFRNLVTGTVHHQTIEGLFGRGWQPL